MHFLHPQASVPRWLVYRALRYCASCDLVSEYFSVAAEWVVDVYMCQGYFCR